MEMTDIYKILPEAAKRKAKLMQDSAKEKHRNNNTQMVIRSSDTSDTDESTLVLEHLILWYPLNSSRLRLLRFQVILSPAEAPVEIQKFPTIEELEAQGAIELSATKSQVTLPNGIQVSSNNDNGSDTQSDGPAHNRYKKSVEGGDWSWWIQCQGIHTYKYKHYAWAWK